MKKDYYEILGLSKESSAQEIKKKYRSLALKYHPDRVASDKKKDSESKFKEISEAYGVLSDPKKRSMYDQYGHAGIDQQYTSEDIFRGADFSGIFEGGLGDVFSQFFGGSGGFDMFGSSGSKERQRGRDIQYEVEVSLEEAYTGVSKKIKIPRSEHCTDCQGTGAKSGTKMKTCATCQGQGQVIMSSGFFRMKQACASCGGRGKTITEYCPKCHGKGAVRVTRSIDVNIPRGVDNSSRLRVNGEGEVGKSGSGDLYLYIFVAAHNVFQREGNDLYMQLPISFTYAALGGEISVPTLNGNVTMKIPEGTQSGKVFRLKSKGMADVHSSVHGDQYVKVMLNVPKKLNQEQRQLLEKFSEISGEHIVSQEDTLKEKIKKIFK